MNDNNPMTKITVRQNMNDFRLVKKGNEGHSFTPDDSVFRYEQFVSFVRQELSDNLPNVVISHHPPSKKFVHPKYDNFQEMNGAYCNDLDDFIIEHTDKISAWVCGHVHNPHTAVIEKTPMFCNPRGYLGVEHTQYDIDLLTFEVGGETQ